MHGRKLASLFLLALFLSGCTSLQTREYPVGTVGYLYNDCRAAIQQPTIEGFNHSWCGQFLDGYYGGLGITGLEYHKKSAPKISPQCQIDAEEEIKRHRQLLQCQDYGFGTPLAGVRVFLAWAEWLKWNNPEMLILPLAPHFNSANKPGPFCHYSQNNTTKSAYNKMHPNLAALRDLSGMTKSGIEDHGWKCVERAPYKDMSAKDFIKSDCGARGAGLLAAVYSQETPAPETVSPGCTKDIRAIRRDIMLSLRICLPHQIAPEDTQHFLLIDENGFCHAEE